MNLRQRHALDNHCRFAFETARRSFCSLTLDPLASVVLSVNSGWE